VLGHFPSVSETFILREILALERQGFSIVPLVLWKRRQKVVHEAAKQHAGQAIYAPPVLSLRCAVIQLIALLQYPGGYLLALRLAVGRMLQHPRQAGKMLARLWQAGYFAVRVSRRTRHIHGHFAGPTTTVAWLLAVITGRSYSFSTHANDIFTDGASALGLKIAEAEFVTACTEYARQWLLKRHRLVAEGKLHLVYHGIDPTEFEPADRPPGRPPMILSVGRLVEKKGFPYLLQAAGILQSRGAEFRLVIVGDGPMRPDLVRMAAGLQLREHVEFAGMLTQRELRRIYEQADLFALASVVAADGDRDGLPNVLLEALAMGIPTVASDISAIPELIEHQKTSKYFDANRNAVALSTLFAQVLGD
jgi:glycosyltransferase involved in cell wall biosynthesis